MSGGASARGHNGVRVVWRAGASHPETPRWLAGENTVAFIDGTRGELLRVAPDGDAGTRVALAAELGFLAAARDGQDVSGIVPPDPARFPPGAKS